MNSQLTGGYRYSPLSKAQAVMLLINHLNGGECVTKSEAESIIERCAKMRPKGYQGLPEEVTVLQGVKGLKGSCLIDSEYIDLSVFSGQKRNDIIAVLEEGKRKYCKGYTFIRQEFEKKGLMPKITQVLCIAVSFVSLMGLGVTKTKTVDLNGIEWSFTESSDDVHYSRNGYKDRWLANFVFNSSNPPFTSAISTEENGIVVFPQKIDNRRFSEIGPFAFYNCTNLVCLVVPPSISNINQLAFCQGNRIQTSTAGWHSVGVYEWTGGSVGNIYFQGDRPKISSVSNLNGRDYGYCYAISGLYQSDPTCWYYLAVKDSVFQGSKLWVDPNAKGWNIGEEWNGGVVRKGPGDVEMLPIDGDTKKVVLSASNKDAKIYYTLNGEIPVAMETESCHLYDGPFELLHMAQVKAIASVDECPYIPMSERWYNVKGTVLAPTLQIGEAQTFYFSNSEVSISCATEGVLIRYTIDGSVVSETCPIYTVPLKISNTTTVRAKAFKTDWFPSDETVRVFTRKWYETETPVISAESAAFDAASQEVTISCATEGATVYYTIDGSEPSEANGRVYRGPFNIYDSVTVKAIAVKEDWKESAVASAAFTKNNGLSAAINMYDYLPDNDANAPWTVDTDVSHDGVSSARSGAIGENGVTTMKVTVRGAGRLSFWWKSECEAWDEDYYDYGAFCVGSETEPRLRIAGMTDWKREEIVFDGTGKHVCKWEYHKDDAETIPRDCIWVDQVQWLPYGESEHDHTLTTEVPVPYLWLDSYGLGRDTDFEAAAKMKLGKVDGAGRAMSVEDDYVAGTDPTNLASKLTATIKMGADGKPIVSWRPPLNGEDADGAGIREGVRSYSVYGKQSLDDAAEKWTPVAEGDEGNFHFFKVGVGMP